MEKRTYTCSCGKAKDLPKTELYKHLLNEHGIKEKSIPVHGIKVQHQSGEGYYVTYNEYKLTNGLSFEECVEGTIVRRW